jgi:hypothetical protein
MRSISGMLTDDLPLNEGEGALHKGGRQMRSISGMPTDDLPLNEGEGALHKGGR